MRHLILSIILLTAALSLGCVYRLAGTGKHFPDYIKTIAIPDFENKTTKFQAEQFVTLAIKEEFIKRSNLVLVENSSEADSVLEGEIIKFRVEHLAYESTSENLYNVKIVLSIKFIDLKNNKIIFKEDRLSFIENYDIESGDFFSQETETIERVAKEFASSVVLTILGNF